MASTGRDGHVPKSKQQIKCWYCKTSMRKDRLEKHTTDQHPGKPKREDGQVPNRSLIDMLSRNRAAEAKGAQHNSAVNAPEVSDEDGGTSEPRGEKRKRTESEDDESEEEDSDKDSKHVKRSKVTNEMKEGTNASISSKLDQVIDILSDMKLSGAAAASTSSRGATSATCHQAQPAEKVASLDQSSLDEAGAMEILIQTSKSIRRICDLATVNPDEQNGVLSCDLCCTETSLKVHKGVGIFCYDFTLGVDFMEKNQPKESVNLKKNIASHITSRSHTSNVIRKGDENERIRKLRAQEQSIGMTLGKQAYRLLKTGRPFADFETDVMLLVDANVKVGNLNHSQRFPSQLRPAFAEAIDTRVKDYMKRPLEATGKPPPVGIIADKLTTRRRTGQMFGGVLFTPGMPSLLTPASLGLESVTQHDGESIAEDISNMCGKYGIDGEQIAGFGFDGQYFNLKVDKKIKDKLQLPDRVNYIWDAAHLLQLADKDMRKNIEWTNDVCSDIGAILSKFSFGKNFEEAINKAHKLNIDFKAPLWFSDTRFAPYAHTVFNNFLQNYVSFGVS